eukprot:735118-Rhodomonas_salina.1
MRPVMIFLRTWRRPKRRRMRKARVRRRTEKPLMFWTASATSEIPARETGRVMSSEITATETGSVMGSAMTAREAKKV